MMDDIDQERRSLFGQPSGKAAAMAMGAIAASAAAPLAEAAAAERGNVTDPDILNFTLNLEYLETEFYLRGVLGQTLDQAMGTNLGGAVRGGRKVAFSTPVREGLLKNITGNEIAHVRFVRATVEALGSRPVARPPIDFEAGFGGVARAAGLPDFNPFANEMNFFLGAMLFEDVGITALKGASDLIRSRLLLESSAGLLAAEGYHMGAVRSVLYKMGAPAHARSAAISDLRDSLDGPDDRDQPVALGQRANIVPANQNGIAFGRTPEHVLNIVYNNPARGVLQGGFFPEGVNGRIRAT
jgi:hypothetical protein